MKKTITYKEIKDKVLDIINNGGGGGGGKSKLSELNDVTITSASAGQVLKFNGTKWVNANGGGGASVKTLTYIGNGESSNIIQFSDKPNVILAIGGLTADSHVDSDTSIIPSVTPSVFGHYTTFSGATGNISCKCAWNNDTNELTLSSGSDTGHIYNYVDKEYFVVYI